MAGRSLQTAPVLDDVWVESREIGAAAGDVLRLDVRKEGRRAVVAEPVRVVFVVLGGAVLDELHGFGVRSGRVVSLELELACLYAAYQVVLED